MRQYQDIEKRWSLLFNTSIGVDLKQAIKDDGDFDPCEDGLRSICWKSFLLNGPLSKASWTRKLKDSRSGYTALRDHFLKYIDNPNNLHSSADPLADDDTSPWATLRQDEASREEIWQDVIRCNIDNYFFREPSTQRQLLDILFIYSKLNPDTGYRQGMHELLAPVLWVVFQDAVNPKAVPDNKVGTEGIDFMLETLDSNYVEHDAFNLFCAMMQTLKSFYEVGDTKDSSIIVAQSERIHKELLGAVDPDLSTHLEVVGVVPQIFAIRWLRLLFGREFEFKDVLRLWDVLFAENLNIEVIDMACVAILLRLRWQLIDADYTTAITTLTRLNLPKEGDSARAIVKDAGYLVKRRTAEAGADITQLRTGRRQYINPLGGEEVPSRSSTPQPRTHRRLRSQQMSPSPSPARFATPQRHLESLFSNVSSNFQKNAEGWSVQTVSKALRGAVGEAKKNFEQLQGNSPRSSIDMPRGSSERQHPPSGDVDSVLVDRLRKLEERNQALARMLEDAQETLRKWKATSPRQSSQDEDMFNTALAKMQFVSVYLTDSDIPIPEGSSSIEQKSIDQVVKNYDPQPSADSPKDEPVTQTGEQHEAENEQKAVPDVAQDAPEMPVVKVEGPESRDRSPSPVRKASARPSLAESSFSFMLGENRHRSSFVKSTPLPEERRNSAQIEKNRKNSSESKTRPKISSKDKADRKPGVKANNSDEDGFTMSTLH
ncbi:hypothetical protein LTR64_004023 [Lithohypha guttulata]|uniref:uncharacterized protein n=1 Tax=Lithohypha guttulata TaxID=1690604 RepID=UPI002DDFF1CD|nr:hypothetical protein LTR51_006683 [Lithohypha guttulata]